MSRPGKGDVRKHVFLPPADLLRAEIYALHPTGAPAAVVVLCPGFNWNGGDWVAKREWREFAEANGLGLIGLSFASDQGLIHEGKGYYYAAQGSGDLLLEAVREIYGTDLPLLLYGFSGGAHFASRFTEWAPERVAGWCAYSAAWWDAPRRRKSPPPGIVACGGADERLQACREYFSRGRDLENPWLWITVPGIKHVTSPGLEDFVRRYFRSVLAGNGNGCWVDIGAKREMSPLQADEARTASAWLPDRTLMGVWEELHAPDP